MRILCAVLLISSAIFAQSAKEEILKELSELKKMRQYVQQELKKNQEILQTIQKEKKNLKQLKDSIDKEEKEIISKRYKKLAKDFENMDPEYAGAKLSHMQDPKIAAYILYNMNPRKAGDALNYVDPNMVNKIASYLTKLRKNAR